MAPLVLVATWLSHLGGASVGREGTAVQIGGSLACAVARREGPALLSRAIPLGIAAGFGSVFGTPWAGALFAIEVPVRGQLAWRRLPGALLAAWIGDQVCRAWGIHHADYPASFQISTLASALPFQIALAAFAFGLVGRGFIQITHGIHSLQTRWTQREWARLFVGSLAIWGLCAILGSRDYLGLGTVTPSPDSVSLLSAFSKGGADPASWLWKLIFTALSVGSGFRGGEVTPLFFVGATLGNTLAAWLGTPTDSLAALGLVCVFCAASHTPWTGVVLGLELFGASSLPFFLIACWISHKACGTVQLYAAQKKTGPSTDTARAPGEGV
jgi:H+/Cl- antiporter ClcA